MASVGSGPEGAPGLVCIPTLTEELEGPTFAETLESSRKTRIRKDLEALAAKARSDQRERWVSIRQPDDVIVRVYRRDVHVLPVPDYHRPCTTLPPVYRGGGPISRETLRRIVHIVGDGPPCWRSLLTVTYHERWPTCGACVARHLNALRTALADRYGRFIYFWVWEYQGRGAPHLHILLNFAPIGTLYRLSRNRLSWREPMEWVSKKWQASICPHYRTPEGLRVGCRWEALENEESAGKYLANYGAKMKQKQIPPGYLPPGQWWGRSQQLPDPEPLYEMRISRAEWREIMGAEVTSSRGSDFRVVHDGRRKVMDAADRLAGVAPLPPSPAEGDGGGRSDPTQCVHYPPRSVAE